jgi:Ca-activated chloride channel family protein
MENKKRTVLALGMVVVLVMTAFAMVPIGVGANGSTTQPPTVTKTASPTDICFGSINTKTTVTIEVTGAGTTTYTAIPMDVVFAIDSSGSMTSTDPDDDRLTAAKYFVDQMDDSIDQAGVVDWDLDVQNTFGLTSNFGTTVCGVKYWIDQVDSSGWTDPDDGLQAAVTMLDDDGQSDSIKVIIFLTDGVPAGPPGDPGVYTYYTGGSAPVDQAADAGYIIYGVGLGASHSSAILEDMADATGGEYYALTDPEDLVDTYDEIYKEIATSTMPHFVDVVEITETYITGHSDFNIAPTSISTSVSGETTIIWEDVAKHVGNKDDALDADETVTLTFKVGANKPGYGLDIQVLPGAKILYSNVEDIVTYWVPIPQATINVKQTEDLIADGGDEYIDVGDIIIWQDADYLYVKYVTTDGWYMTETHLDVDNVKADIPQTGNGNPKIGKFEFSGDHSPAVQVVEYKIDWDWASDALIYIAAHAVVQKDVSLIECTEPEWRIETAWGEGNDFGGPSWAMLMEYQDP